jgi:hypothetical protein
MAKKIVVRAFGARLLGGPAASETGDAGAAEAEPVVEQAGRDRA